MTDVRTHRETQAARRLAPLTGIKDVDADAVMLYALVLRLEANFALAAPAPVLGANAADSRARQPNFVRLMNATWADIAPRGGMGPSPQGTEDGNGVAGDRVQSEFDVARAAIERIVKRVREDHNALERAVAERAALAASLEALQTTESALRHERDSKHALMRSQTSLDGALGVLTEVWRRAKAEGHDGIDGFTEQRVAQLRHVGQLQRAAMLEASAQRAITNEISDGHIQSRDDDIVALKKRFIGGDRTATLLASAPAEAPEPAETTALDAMSRVQKLRALMEAARCFEAPVEAVAPLPPADAEATPTAEDAIATVDAVLELAANSNAANADGLWLRRQRKAAFLVTRTAGSRFVSRLDPTATMIGVMSAVLRSAPASFLALQLQWRDPHRLPALSVQARATGLGALWLHCMSLQRPVVVLVEQQCGVTPSGPATTAGGQLLPMASTHRASVSMVSRDRTAAGGAFDRPVSAALLNEPSQALQAAATTRPVGIVGRLSTMFRRDRRSLVADDVLRCYASSAQAGAPTEGLIAEYESPSRPFFCTMDKVGEYIEVCFPRATIIPDGYSFGTCHPTAGGALFPRNWRLDAATDAGTRWITLARHMEDRTLHVRNPVGVWGVAPPIGPDIPFAFSRFRIVSEGPNSRGSLHLNASCFEIYGRALFGAEAALVQPMPSGPIEGRPVAPAPLAPIGLPGAGAGGALKKKR